MPCARKAKEQPNERNLNSGQPSDDPMARDSFTWIYGANAI